MRMKAWTKLLFTTSSTGHIFHKESAILNVRLGSKYASGRHATKLEWISLFCEALSAQAILRAVIVKADFHTFYFISALNFKLFSRLINPVVMQVFWKKQTFHKFRKKLEETSVMKINSKIIAYFWTVASLELA